MKKLIVCIFFLSLFTFCQNKKQYFSSSPEIDVAKKMLDAYHSKDWKTMRSSFSDSATVTVNVGLGKGISSEEYISLLQEQVAELQSYATSDNIFFEMIIDENDKKWVHAWSEWNATFLNGNEATTVINFGWLVENGKVKIMTLIYDSYPIIRAQKNDEETEMG